MIWCIPGFLGRPSDFDAFGAACAARGLPAARPVPLFSRVRRETLEEFGAKFSSRIAREDPQAFLVGYSLGGRLALHALLANPSVWRGAIIISAHGGLPGAAEREVRQREDAAWAHRFERDPWDALLASWDARDAFAGRPRGIDRPAQAFSRNALAHGLRVWGLGQQDDLAPRLGTITCPVLWVAGAQDRRFVAEAERAMQYLPQGALAVAPGAAHRVPWETPDWFHTSAGAFLQSLT